MTKIIHFMGEINGSFRVHYLDKKPRNLNFMLHSKPRAYVSFFAPYKFFIYCFTVKMRLL